MKPRTLPLSPTCERLRPWRLALVAIFALLTCSATMTLAQPPLNKTKIRVGGVVRATTKLQAVRPFSRQTALATRPVLLPNSTFLVKARAPIAFRPLPLIDPQSGKPVAPDTLVATPQDGPGRGRKIPAREYYEQLNALEKGFNNLGYSLRTPGDAEIVLQEKKVNVALLQRQKVSLQRLNQRAPRASIVFDKLAPALKAAQSNFKLQGVARENAVRSFSSSQVALNPGVAATVKSKFSVANVGSLGPRTVWKDKTAPTEAPPKYDGYDWGESWGDRNTFSAAFNVGVRVDSSLDQTNASAEANLGGTVFNRDFDVLRATANYHARKSGEANFRFMLSAAGNTLYDYGGTASFNDEKSFNFPAFEVKIRFTVGPVPVSVAVGARGSIGLRYHASALVTQGRSHRPVGRRAATDNGRGPLVPGLLVAGEITPFANIKVYAEAAVDLWVVSAGVGCELTLLEEQVPLYVQAQLVSDDPGRDPYFRLAVGGRNRMTALDGRMYVFVKVWYFFGSKTWRANIFDWDGVRDNRVIFEFDEVFPAFNRPT